MPKTSKRPAAKLLEDMTPEERFLAFKTRKPKGYGLQKAECREAQEARAGITYLLAQVRTNGAFKEPARRVLQSCAAPDGHPLPWLDVMSLPMNYWRVLQPLLHYVYVSEGLCADDFEDGGKEFCRHVFPMPAKASKPRKASEVAAVAP